MNHDHLMRVIQHFDLGQPVQVLERVYGGLLHIMWRLDTDKGTYAIKQLSKDINLSDECVIQNYELSEKIASRFVARGIPGVYAIAQSGKHLLIIDATGFLVYPWVDAKALDKDAVSITHALEVARVLAKMHLIDLNISDIEQADFYVHENEKMIALVDLAKKQNLIFCSVLLENLEPLLKINKNYHDAISILKTNTVISHGDLDQKNVLWDNSNHPILIDWESARKLNPTYEIVNSALDWSGIATEFNKNLFGEMIRAYQEAGGIIDQTVLEAAFYGVLGNWINWMVYNIRRASSSQDLEQKKIGTEQVTQVLSTILRVKDLMPELMTNTYQPVNITLDLARKLIAEQFPEYAHFPITSVEKQGHDNRTYRLGNDLLIRMPTAESYALKVPKEQALLPKLMPHLTVSIPAPIKMGSASQDYPYPFSIYKWLEGTSINLLVLDNDCLKKLAFDLARFLTALQSIVDVAGPAPGQHNWWRGAHVSVYDQGARQQISALSTVINEGKAIDLWERACKTIWDKPPVWIHGDFAIGNMLLKNSKLSAIIDFGGMALGDPACDLVIAWTFLNGKSREIFIQAMDSDEDTWLRAKAWALWKATFELCQIADKNSLEALIHKRIIEDVIHEKHFV